MVQLHLTEEQGFFRDTTRKYLEAEVPLTTVRDLYEHADGFDRGWWREAAALGWTSMFVPEAQGGGSLTGRPLADAVIVAEEIGRRVAPGPFMPVCLVAAAVATGGSDELIQSLLPPLVTGESIATWAHAEPGDCWDPERFTTTMTEIGDELVVRGEKAYVEAASASDHFVVTTRDQHGLAQVLVPRDAGGVTVVPGRSVDITRRYGRVRFDEVRVPAGNRLGDDTETSGDVESTVQLAIALQCAEMIGIADAVFETTLDYGRERIAFGRPIVSFQALKHRIADMAVWIEGSKAVGEALTDAIDARIEGCASLASVAKTYVADSGLDIVDDCVQITGGIGVTWEHDIHLYNRRMIVDRAMVGTPEFHRNRLLTTLAEDGIR